MEFNSLLLFPPNQRVYTRAAEDYFRDKRSEGPLLSAVIRTWLRPWHVVWPVTNDVDM